MEAIWATIRAPWRALYVVANAVAVVLLFVAVFSPETKWVLLASLLLVVSALPTSLREAVRATSAPKPRPSSHQRLARSPLLLIPLTLVASFGWAIWFAFGRLWLGALAAFAFGLPLFGQIASLALMEPGPRKNRVFLAFTMAMLVLPILTIVAAFATVSQRP